MGGEQKLDAKEEVGDLWVVLRRNEHTLTSLWFPPRTSQLSSPWSYEAGDYSISESLYLVQFRSLDTKPVAEDPQGHTGLDQLPSCPRRSLLPQQFIPHRLWLLPGSCPALVSSPQSIPTSFPAPHPSSRRGPMAWEATYLLSAILLVFLASGEDRGQG